MLSVFMLSIIMLSVLTLNVVVLSVVAPNDNTNLSIQRFKKVSSQSISTEEKSLKSLRLNDKKHVS